jgi:hypothetical protein
VKCVEEKFDQKKENDWWLEMAKKYWCCLLVEELWEMMYITYLQ